MRFATRRFLTAVLVCSAGVSTCAATAQATPPGEVGDIVLVSESGGSQEIWTMGADGSAPVQLTFTAQPEAAPTFSPGGARIAFTSLRDGNFEIYVMGADGSQQTRLTTDAESDFAPAFSPDGKRIVFSSDRDGDREIYVMNSDGTGQTRLTSANGLDETPVFSPDGSRIAFVSDRDGSSDVWVMNANGGAQTNLTGDPAIDVDPDWSPDGKRIIFTSNRVGMNQDVFTMAADGTDVRHETNEAAFVSQPVYSPDGKSIAYVVDWLGYDQIWSRPADGSPGLKVLTSGEWDSSWPDWAALAAEEAPIPPVLPGATPTLNARVESKASQRWRRLRARVSCSVACSAELTGSGRVGRKPIRAKPVELTLAQGETQSVSLRLDRWSRRVVRTRKGTLKLRLEAQAGTERSTMTAKVKLRR